MNGNDPSGTRENKKQPVSVSHLYLLKANCTHCVWSDTRSESQLVGVHFLCHTDPDLPVSRETERHSTHSQLTSERSPRARRVTP